MTVRIMPSPVRSPRECRSRIELNGMDYVVLMTTADALDDLAFGFARSERLIERPGDIIGVDA